VATLSGKPSYTTQWDTTDRSYFTLCKFRLQLLLSRITADWQRSVAKAQHSTNDLFAQKSRSIAAPALLTVNLIARISRRFLRA
ncbi:MAG TPA: hypothetical protein PK823_12390, partial [Novosphingobium sp.]|nr:hypothetical protein [Novosphingobium sp.]